MLLQGYTKGRGCLVSALTARVSSSTGRLYTSCSLHTQGTRLCKQAQSQLDLPSRLVLGKQVGRSAGGRAPWHFSGALTQAGLSVQRAALTCRTGYGVNMSPALSGWGQTMPSADCLFINLPHAHRCLSLSEFKLNGSLSVTQKGLAQADKIIQKVFFLSPNTESPHTQV